MRANEYVERARGSIRKDFAKLVHRSAGADGLQGRAPPPSQPPCGPKIRSTSHSRMLTADQNPRDRIKHGVPPGRWTHQEGTGQRHRRCTTQSRPHIRCVILRKQAARLATEPTLRMRFARSVSMRVAFSRVRSLPTCRLCRRRSSNSSSMPTQPECLASPYPTSYSQPRPGDRMMRRRHFINRCSARGRRSAARGAGAAARADTVDRCAHEPGRR